MLDVSCRCYALGQIDIEEVLTEIKKENGWGKTSFESGQVLDAIRMIKKELIQSEKPDHNGGYMTIDFYQDGTIKIDAPNTHNGWVFEYRLYYVDRYEQDTDTLEKIKEFIADEEEPAEITD